MSVIDEIKQRVDIVDLVGDAVTLKKSGRNFKANCPFHNERTPSFYVFPDRQYWQCFGACAEGGDIFSFVQKRESSDFRAALRTLAERAGVQLESSRPRDNARDDRLDRLRAANEAAASFYHNLLLQSADGAESRSYLETRGLDARTVGDFQLGFAPGRGALLNRLSEKGFASAELIDAGLCVENEKGVFDRFHDRLVIPIRDERGRVTGFGGRTMVGDAAKYLNTPQTDLFDKSATLYALDRARDAIREKDLVVVVEGYMDVIAAHQFGYRNVVAEMGTALTEKQVTILKRYSRNLTLALDADAAGSEATMRGIEVASANSEREVAPVVAPGARGFIHLQEQSATQIRIIAIPEGKDPDDLIRKDSARWERLVDEAKPVIDHVLDRLPERFNLTDPNDSSKAAKEAAPVIAAISEPVLRDLYTQRLARLVHVDESTLRPLIAALRSPRRPQARSAEAAPQPQPRSSEPVEEHLLALLFAFPALREFQLPDPRRVLTLAVHQALWEAWHEHPTIEEMRESLPEELQPELERVLARTLPPLDDTNAENALAETIWKLEQRNLRRAKMMTVDAISDAESRAREEGSLVVDLIGMLSQAQSGLNEEEAGELAEVYVEDWERGVELHQRLLARYHSREPLSEGTKQAIHARLLHQRTREDEIEGAAS
ncbi:MAG: DNA primase [Dehalococcoidia bacterium]|nr:DNA primase [Dehalococcoidia bacterium]